MCWRRGIEMVSLKSRRRRDVSFFVCMLVPHLQCRGFCKVRDSGFTTKLVVAAAEQRVVRVS